MRYTRYIFMVFPLFFNNLTNGQSNDFGSWVSIEFSKRITKKVTLEIEEEARIFKNFREIDRFATSFGGAYRINKTFKTGAGYSWIYDHHVKKEIWENRHRYYYYIQARRNLGRFTLTLRERFQSTYRDESIEGFKYNPRNYLRSRFEIAYNIKGIKLEPYTSAEMHYQLNNPLGNKPDNLRFTAGAEFRLTKKINLDAFFRLNREINVSKPESLYITGLNMKFRL